MMVKRLMMEMTQLTKEECARYLEHGEEMDREQDGHYRWACDTDSFYRDCHDLLALAKRIAERSDAMGYLTDLQRAAVGSVWQAMNELFNKPDHQDERPF